MTNASALNEASQVCSGQEPADAGSYSELILLAVELKETPNYPVYPFGVLTQLPEDDRAEISVCHHDFVPTHKKKTSFHGGADQSSMAFCHVLGPIPGTSRRAVVGTSADNILVTDTAPSPDPMKPCLVLLHGMHRRTMICQIVSPKVA